MLISQKNLEGNWLGKGFLFVFILGLVFRGFFKIYLYTHTQSASLLKEVILQMTELTPLQHMEYPDLSSKISIQK